MLTIKCLHVQSHHVENHVHYQRTPNLLLHLTCIRPPQKSHTKKTIIPIHLNLLPQNYTMHCIPFSSKSHHKHILKPTNSFLQSLIFHFTPYKAFRTINQKNSPFITFKIKPNQRK
ncbi:unnamed protein product [Vicia faba]|uniref:Uncharacterized protein n=1 Tax=Vicia faba TaxID=3906 RepID=A0AAV0ZAQ7_VICFA|nr:unnamed protein product [Vicia faba]